MRIVTKEEADKYNLKTYFNGELCKKGHKSSRVTSNDACISCLNEEFKAFRLKINKPFNK